jgi:hypothetical protein
MATPAVFYSYNNGYGYERLAIVTDVGTVLLRVEQGGLAEISVVDYRYSVETLNRSRLTPDPDSRRVWQQWLEDANKLACDDEIIVNLRTPEFAQSEGCDEPEYDLDEARAMRPILLAAGFGDVTAVWMLDADLDDTERELFTLVSLV